MVRIVLFAVALTVVVIVWAAVDCAMISRERIRGVNRGVWMLIILFLPVLGMLLWFTVGRSRPRGVVAPEDDEAFMAELAKLLDEEHGGSDERGKPNS